MILVLLPQHQASSRCVCARGNRHVSVSEAAGGSRSGSASDWHLARSNAFWTWHSTCRGRFASWSWSRATGPG